MPISAALSRALQAVFHQQRKYSDLAQPSSTVVRTVARVAATILVLASAGFGSVYAWSTGSEHGAILAALSLLMAVGLECCKPLSVAYALTAFRSLAVIRGTCLAALAAVAITYSLTAELTLMAGARGDVVAKREATLKANTDAQLEAQRARDRYDAAKAELASLPAARSAGELQAGIDAIDRTPGILIDGAPCGGVANGRVTRELCPKRALLVAEHARAQRHAELEAIIATPLPVAHAAVGATVKVADPGAAALATYLAALGFVIPAHVLTEWLVLIPVLALEVGSALAGVLVHAVSGSDKARRIEQKADTGGGSVSAQSEKVSGAPKTPAAPDTAVSGSTPNRRPKRTRRNDKGGHGGPRTGGQRMLANVVALLKERGGRIEAGQRGIGRLLGMSKSRVNELLHELAAAGAVVLSTSKSGTVVELSGG